MAENFSSSSTLGLKMGIGEKDFSICVGVLIRHFYCEFQLLSASDKLQSAVFCGKFLWA